MSNSNESFKGSLGKSRLGRGLGSLLGANDSGYGSIAPTDINRAPVTIEVANAESVAREIEHHPSSRSEPLSEARIWDMDIDKVKPNQHQPRHEFDKEKLAELAASIKEQGILLPVVARKKLDGGFEIIAGERRWRAAQMAGLKKIPVILRKVDDKKSLELALIENVQRENLHPLEEAKAYRRLIEEHQLTQAEVAQRVGKDRVTVTNSLRLLMLPPEVLALMMSGGVSVGHAKVLLSLGDPKTQIALAQKVEKEKISVRQLEALVKEQLTRCLAEKVVAPQDATRAKLVAQLAEQLQKAMGRKVQIDYRKQKGKVAIHFYSDADLNQIVDALQRACHSP